MPTRTHTQIYIYLCIQLKSFKIQVKSTYHSVNQSFYTYMYTTLKTNMMGDLIQHFIVINQKCSDVEQNTWIFPLESHIELYIAMYFNSQRRRTLWMDET